MTLKYSAMKFNYESLKLLAKEGILRVVLIVKETFILIH